MVNCIQSRKLKKALSFLKRGKSVFPNIVFNEKNTERITLSLSPSDTLDLKLQKIQKRSVKKKETLLFLHSSPTSLCLCATRKECLFLFSALSTMFMVNNAGVWIRRARKSKEQEWTMAPPQNVVSVHRQISPIGHFTVVCLVTSWPVNARGDLSLIQTSLLFLFKCKAIIMNLIFTTARSLSNKLTCSLAVIQRPGH